LAVLSRPGQEGSFARGQPGWEGRPGNQTRETCIPGCMYGQVWGTKHALSDGGPVPGSVAVSAAPPPGCLSPVASCPRLRPPCTGRRPYVCTSLSPLASVVSWEPGQLPMVARPWLRLSLGKIPDTHYPYPNYPVICLCLFFIMCC
jgi:hypothetical protein